MLLSVRSKTAHIATLLDHDAGVCTMGVVLAMVNVLVIAPALDTTVPVPCLRVAVALTSVDA